MPFRYLLPLAEEMARHKAQEILRSVSSTRLAGADNKSFEFQQAIQGLEEAAYGAPADDMLPPDQPLTIEAIKATMSFLGTEFEVIG